MKHFLFFILLLTVSIFSTAQKAKKRLSGMDPTIWNSYDSVISNAVSSISQEDFEQARSFYQQALILKPKDEYAIKMINYVNTSIWALREKQKRDEELRRKSEINRLMKNALNKIIEKNYDSAQILFRQILTLNPIGSHAEFAKRKIETIDVALGRNPEKSIDFDSLPKVLLLQGNRELPTVGTTTNEQKNNIPPAMGEQDLKLKQKEPANQGDYTKKSIGDVNATITPPKPTANRSTSTRTLRKPVTAKVKEKEKGDVQSHGKVKSMQKGSSISVEEGGLRAGPANVDVLLDNAALAIKYKNYREARKMYKKVLASNCPAGKKEFAKMVIKAIDKVVAKEGQTIK